MTRYNTSIAVSRGTLLDARSSFYRAGLVLAVVTALTAGAVRAGAQTYTTDRFEARPFVGAFVPTGDQRDLLKDAVLAGVQGSWHFTPRLALVGTFGWSPSEDRTRLTQQKIDLFQYDLGLEGRLSDLTSTSRFSTQPYAALGLGGRTYDYRDLAGASAQTNFLGYGAVGLDVAPKSGILGLRIEARDNVSAFKGLRGELAESKAHNDMQFTGGLTFRF